jgi:hypothetical protein
MGRWQSRETAMRLTRTVAALGLSAFMASGAMCAAPGAPPPAATPASALLAVDLNRVSIVDGILARWREDLRATSGEDRDAAESALREGLLGLRADELLSARLAGTVQGLGIAFALSDASDRAERGAMAKSGVPANLLYVPVTPCRILDTRYGSGPFGAPIAGGVAFSVSGYLTSFAAQGGSGTNCGLSPNQKALVVVLTVVAPSADAFLAAGDSSSFATLTQSAMMNFRAGINLANTAIVPMNMAPPLGLFFLALPAGVSTHVVADAVGYFIQPTASGPANMLSVAKSGADFTSIQAAISSIVGLASPTNRFLIKVAPGTYDESISVPGYVTVEGSGKSVTVIRSNNASSGTVNIDGVAELRDLDVVNDSAPGNAIAIYQNNFLATSSTLTRVGAYAYGTGGVARAAEIAGSTNITDSRFVAKGPGSAEGLFVWGGGPFTVRDSVFEASLANDSRAVVVGSNTSGTLTGSMLSASGVTSAFALEKRDQDPYFAAMRIMNSTLLAKDAAFTTGIGYGPVDVSGSIVEAYGPGTNHGIGIDVGSITQVRNSKIVALGGPALVQVGSGTIHVSNSQVDGGTQGSLIKCRSTWTSMLDTLACPL